VRLRRSSSRHNSLPRRQGQRKTAELAGLALRKDRTPGQCKLPCAAAESEAGRRVQDATGPATVSGSASVSLRPRLPRWRPWSQHAAWARSRQPSAERETRNGCIWVARPAQSSQNALDWPIEDRRRFRAPPYGFESRLRHRFDVLTSRCHRLTESVTPFTERRQALCPSSFVRPHRSDMPCHAMPQWETELFAQWLGRTLGMSRWARVAHGEIGSPLRPDATVARGPAPHVNCAAFRSEYGRAGHGPRSRPHVRVPITMTSA